MPNVSIRQAMLLTTAGVATNKYLDIAIEQTIPLLVIQDDIIDKCVFKSVISPPVTMNTLNNQLSGYEIDNNGVITLIDRYVYVGNCVSPITGNVVTVYYDKQYSDLFVIPFINGIDTNGIVTNKFKLPVTGYSLGAGPNVNTLTTISKLPYKSLELPTAKENISIETMSGSLNGISAISEGVINTHNHSDLAMTKDPDTKVIVNNATTTTNLVSLGKVSDFLTKVVKIPVGMVVQISKEGHKVIGIGTVDTKSSDIYFELNF